MASYWSGDENEQYKTSIILGSMGIAMKDSHDKQRYNLAGGQPCATVGPGKGYPSRVNHVGGRGS